MTGGAIRLEQLVKSFDGVPAVTGIDLDIPAGQFYSLLGASGCGKTTTLRMIAGFEKPDSGRIELDGRDVAGDPPHKRPVNTVFQTYALFPFMAVWDNVAFGLKYQKASKEDTKRLVGEALELARMGDFAKRRPAQLSGGQQQRVALARALVIRPKVLLLDEPFSALDRNLRASMQVEIKEIQRKLGVTTIFVTHDQSEALSLSDRIAVLAEGRIRQLGTPDEIYCRPVDRFVASFVGDVNVLHARLEHIHGATAALALGPARVLVPALTLQGAAPGAMVDLFVRPEELRVADEGTPAAVCGIVAAQIYQGGHVDLYVDVPEAASGRVLIRVPGPEGMSLWPAGARIGITLAVDKAIAFRAAADAGIPNGHA
jgi:spermidine/putrescine transport system ATP-binding protein